MSSASLSHYDRYGDTVLKDSQEQSRWLSRHAANVTSQCGEDGIIAKALTLLPERTSWCVVFGAWDGKFGSNTYELIAATDLNLLFVAAEHYAAFGIADNSPALMGDDSGVPHILVGCDGHVFLLHGKHAGSISLPWHGLKLKEPDVQRCPSACRNIRTPIRRPRNDHSAGNFVSNIGRAINWRRG